jgi:hypothetical protein
MYWKEFEGIGIDLNKVLFRHLTWGTEKNMKPLRITDILAEIRTEHPLN